jgi:hypothetical protein
MAKSALLGCFYKLVHTYFQTLFVCHMGNEKEAKSAHITVEHVAQRANAVPTRFTLRGIAQALRSLFFEGAGRLKIRGAQTPDLMPS